MPRLIPDENGLFKCQREDGSEVMGYLDVDFIPSGPGSQIVNNVRFVTIAPEGETQSSDEVLRQLTGSAL